MSDLEKNHNNSVESTVEPSPSYEEISAVKLWIFVILTAFTQVITQACLAQTLVPFKYISETLGVESAGEISWFTASYSLTVGTFILIAGQIGDLFGYKKLYIIGYIWLGISSLCCGFVGAFSKNHIAFDIFRALQGLGLAICMPNSLALIGNYFPHGSHAKNISLSIFGGVAPGGFVIGAVFSSLLSEFAWWPWCFWITGITSFVIVGIAFIFIPKGIHGETSLGWSHFDYWGSLVGVTGLILFNFAWNQGPVVGWEKPYVYVLLIVGLLFMIGFFYVELKISKRPLVPKEVLTGDTGLVLLCIVTGWSCFGVWIFYTFQFSEEVLHQSTLVATAQIVPTMFAGFCAGISTTYLLKFFSTSVVMTAALCFFLIGSCLMGTRPVDQIFWSQKFVSTILTPFGMDMSFPAATIILSHHLAKEHQGVAGSVIATCVNYSISIGLGIAGTVQRYTDPTETDVLKGIRSAFYTGIGLASFGVICGLIFMAKQRKLRA